MHMQDSAQRIAAKLGKPAPVPATKRVRYFGSFKEYVRVAGLIDANEETVLQALCNYESNKRAHTLAVPQSSVTSRGRP
jgi:hypothetical protein